jgi:rSAM/selenodomain-associated transferase 1
VTISHKYRPRVVVMLKQPRAGRVKTRLGKHIGMTGAAWWFRHQTAKLLRQISDPRWEVVLATAPNNAVSARSDWPLNLRKMAQGHGDLGTRMARMFRQSPLGPTLIIGGDIPEINKHHLASAFAELGGNDAVLGPAIDGGYWLIGLKSMRVAPYSFLKNVRWSTPDAMQDTVATMTGMKIAFIEELADVDSASDLKHLNARRRLAQQKDLFK